MNPLARSVHDAAQDIRSRAATLREAQARLRELSDRLELPLDHPLREALASVTVSACGLLSSAHELQVALAAAVTNRDLPPPAPEDIPEPVLFSIKHRAANDKTLL